MLNDPRALSSATFLSFFNSSILISVPVSTSGLRFAGPCPTTNRLHFFFLNFSFQSLFALLIENKKPSCLFQARNAFSRILVYFFCLEARHLVLLA